MKVNLSKVGHFLMLHSNAVVMSFSAHEAPGPVSIILTTDLFMEQIDKGVLFADSFIKKLHSRNGIGV